MSVLANALAPNLRIVLCGSAVGAASALRRAYYAGPGNAFWPALFQVGLIPNHLRPSPSVPAVLEDEFFAGGPIAESQIEVQEGPLEFRFSRSRPELAERV